MTRVKGEELGKKRKKVENKREEKDEGGVDRYEGDERKEKETSLQRKK